MKKSRIIKKFLSCLCAFALLPAVSPITHAANTLIAFPGAEGAGKYATGGRGGKVYHVTNLNDSGAGSFRDAVSGSNRIVVFDVGGTINLKSAVIVKSNITILGQTAPGGAGITLSGNKLAQGGSNQIIRFISSRPGERGSGEYDAWGGSDGSNSIIDHCSIGWANDEQWGLYSYNTNQTVQYSIIGPSNCISTHAKGAHGFGVMFGSYNITWHHNMIAHNISRNFRGKVGSGYPAEFVNNVLYDWGYQTGYGTLGKLNYVGNYLKKGPSTKGGNHFFSKSSGSGYEKMKFYVAGNKLVKSDGTDYSSSIVDNNWSGVSGFDEATYGSSEYIAVSDINGNDASVTKNAESADAAFEHVLSFAGAGINADSRPKIDKQVMEEARTGTGNLTGGRAFSGVTDSDQLSAISKYDIKECDYESYYPAAVSKSITDSDGDGMSDEWEELRGLDPNKDDSTGDYLGQGYMNIEYYANDLTVDAFPEGVVTESPTSVVLGPEYAQIKEDLATITLSPSAIKSASELTLPQKGSAHGQDIVWVSSSSAIKLSNNQISSVTRKNEDQSVTLTASISSGEYNMSKSFNITVLSSNTVWKASEADNGKAKGTELFDGLTTLFDATYKASTAQINGESFAGYISHPTDSGGFSDGTATGTAFKYEASQDGFLTAYVVKLGNADKAKTLYITEEGASGSEQSIASVSGNAENKSLSAQVKAGKTYYIYVAGSKGSFAGIEFSRTSKPIWWKASVSGAAGTALSGGLYPFSDMAYTEGAKEIDGESFTGWISGTANGNYADGTASGSGIRYTPEKSGEITVYVKINDGKTYFVKDSAGNEVVSNKNEEGVNAYTSFTSDVKGGETYYIYIAGSKGAFYGMSFTETISADEPEITPTPTPANTQTPEASAAPEKTPAPTSVPEAGTIKVEKVFKNGNTVSYEVENGEGVTLDTYIASYTEGRLTSVIKSSDVVKDGKISFTHDNIPEGSKVFVWNKMMPVYAPCVFYTE